MIYIVLAVLIIWGFNSEPFPWVGIIVSAIALGFLIYRILPSYFAMQGRKAYNEDDIKKTKKYYNKAISFIHAKVNINITYLLILMRIGELDKALKLADSLTTHPKATQNEKYIVKEYRCLIYHKQGNSKEALEDAKEIFANFKNTTIYSLLGYLMLACDEPIKETMDFCLEAYDYNSDERDIVDNLALAYYKNGEYEKAEELAEELIKMSPTFVEAHYHSALIAKALGKTEKAKAFLDNMDDCIRTALTTVTEEEIELLRKSL